MVSQSECGVTRIGHRYVRAVMVACELLAEGAEDGAATDDKAGARETYVVGLDPETGEPVMRGSERDAELSEKDVWWTNGHWRG